MLYDLEYMNLPDDLKDILLEEERHKESLRLLNILLLITLSDQGLIPDERIDMIRISDGGDYERLIDLKPR